MKKVLILIVLVALAGAAYWYIDRSGYFDRTGPTNLPTREERKRMEAIEETSNTIAPNAKAGIQVREKGTTPPPPPPRARPKATSTATSTEGE